MIILIIVSLICGDFGGALQFARLIAFVSSPYVFCCLYRAKKIELQYVLLFFLIWYIYCLISLLWTSDVTTAMKELFYYYCNFTLFLLLYFLAQKANKSIHSILIGWVALFLLSSVIALYEIIFDQHLLSSFGSDVAINTGEETLRYKKYASVTFGNYNAYVTVLCFILPFLFSYLLCFSKIKNQILGWICIILLSYLLFTNASRGGLLCLLICLPIFLYYYRYVKVRGKKAILFLCVFIVFTGIYYYAAPLFSQILLRFIGQDSIVQDDSRSELIELSMLLVSNSFGFGTGVGSLQASMAQITSGITITHNLFMELLVQYGLLLFIYFTILLVGLYSKAWKSRNLVVRHTLFSAIFSFPLLSIINSGYLLMPSLWVFFSSLFFFSTIKADD